MTTLLIVILSILTPALILSIAFPSLADVERWAMIRRMRNMRYNCRKRNARLRADHAWHTANRAICARPISLPSEVEEVIEAATSGVTSSDIKDRCTANGVCTITWKPSKPVSPRSSQYWEEIEEGLRAAAAEWHHSA